MRHASERLADADGAIPLCWAAAAHDQGYVNLGDALSPVMVAAVSGRKIRHLGADARACRLAAVGTIGHALRGGEVWIWGTGSSRFSNPLAPARDRLPFSLPPQTVLHVRATRGPESWRLLTGGEPGTSAVFGDPVWLLPRFYRPQIMKRFELGVILHLSELADRATEAHPLPGHRRYRVPADLAKAVKLINTVTAIDPEAMRARIDDILSCKRIVSTSLHGMVFAESYGIPCLYFPPRGREPGPARVRLGDDDELNLRFTDLYLGLGERVLALYRQPRAFDTDWEAVCAAIDQMWAPKSLDEERLIEAFPLPVAPIAAGARPSLFAHPLVTSIPFKP